MLYLHITVHILETVITDGMQGFPLCRDCQIINIAFVPCTYLQKAEAVEKWLTGVWFCFLNGNKEDGTTLMMSPTVRNVSGFCLPLHKVWMATISRCC